MAPRQRLRSFCAGPFCAVAPGSIGFELALCAGVLVCARACSCVCAHVPEKPGHPPAPVRVARTRVCASVCVCVRVRYATKPDGPPFPSDASEELPTE